MKVNLEIKTTGWVKFERFSHTAKVSLALLYFPAPILYDVMYGSEWDTNKVTHQTRCHALHHR